MCQHMTEKYSKSTALQGILIAVITAGLTTFGNYYVSSYTKKVEHENWIGQQDYLSKAEHRKEYETLTKELLKQHTELRSLKLKTIELRFKLQAILLNPSYPEHVLILEQQKVARQLQEHLSIEKQSDRNYQLLLMNIGIFVSENLGEQVTDYLKVRINTNNPVPESVNKLKQQLASGLEYDSVYADLVQQAQENYVAQDQEDAFIKLLSVIRKEQRTKQTVQAGS